jgi:hypothetical protein
MAAIITYTYETILDELKKDRAGTYQLFGYDFMFDEDLSTYLIEVNREPYVILSTRVHKK